jgi:hypothetical protein
LQIEGGLRAITTNRQPATFNTQGSPAKHEGFRL